VAKRRRPLRIGEAAASTGEEANANATSLESTLSSSASMQPKRDCSVPGVFGVFGIVGDLLPNSLGVEAVGSDEFWSSLKAKRATFRRHLALNDTAMTADGR